MEPERKGSRVAGEMTHEAAGRRINEDVCLSVCSLEVELGVIGYWE